MTINLPSMNASINNLTVNGTVNSGADNSVKIGSGIPSALTNGSVAIGENANANGSSGNSVIIGALAGQTAQTGYGAVGIGLQALQNSPNADRCVCIGMLAGNSGAGSHCVCIGYRAGDTNVPANTVVINATNASLGVATAGTFIAPITGIASGNAWTPNVATQGTWGMLVYNPTTGEIRYAVS
jgi:hypothetical protein